VLQIALVPYLLAPPTPGAPDPEAFHHWRQTLQSDLVISGLAYGDGKWVGVGNGLHYSTNGVDWQRTDWTGEHYWKAIYAEGVFVAVGQPTFPIMASTNGINWRGMYPEQPNTTFWDVAYGNGTFVVVGQGNLSVVINTNPPSTWWLPNQGAWVSVPQPQSLGAYGVFFANGKFVAAGYGPMTAVSTNGRDWVVTRHTGYTSSLLENGTYHNGRYIVVGDQGLILVSDDAVTWAQRPSPTLNELWAVAAHENQYVAVGFGVMFLSTNGLDWETSLIDPQKNFTDVIVGENSFAGVYYVPALGPSAVYRSDPFNFVAPLFTLQPVHTEQRIGFATNLIAAADGTSPVTYQWQKDGIDIPGATSGQLAFTKLERGDDAKYRVFAHNSIGETASAEARLTVGLPVRITALPVSQAAPVGGSVTFSVEYEGTPPITNRWRKPGSIFVTQVVNEATSFLHLENVQPGNAGTYGVLVENKYALTGSGPITLSVLSDSDGNGLPDDWEAQYGLRNPAQDFDGDGMTNLQEYEAGTDPRDARSYLKVERIEAAPGADKVVLSFLARSNHTYTIQGRETLSALAWTRVMDAVAAPTDRLVTATNAVTTRENYFRLVTPRQE